MTVIPPPAIHAGRRFDRPAAERAATELLLALGADLTDEGMRKTPHRLVAAYAEMLTPRAFDATTFRLGQADGELVVVRAIPFSSLCMHHLLPFHGFAHIGYLPRERILGLSKFARVVDFYSRDFQVQERLTAQIADWVQKHLTPRGVGVVLEAEHLCMSLRGVKTSGAKTVTSGLHGAVREDPACRQQFLAAAMAASRPTSEVARHRYEEEPCDAARPQVSGRLRSAASDEGFRP